MLWSPPRHMKPNNVMANAPVPAYAMSAAAGVSQGGWLQPLPWPHGMGDATDCPHAGSQQARKVSERLVPC